MGRVCTPEDRFAEENVGNRFCHQIQNHCLQRHLAPFSLSLQHRYFSEALFTKMFHHIIYEHNEKKIRASSNRNVTQIHNANTCDINKNVLLLVYNFFYFTPESSYTSKSNFVICKKSTCIFRLIQGRCSLCSFC